MANKSTCLELYIVDQLSEAEVNGAPHPRVHPSSPHASEDRRVVVRVVPFNQKKALEEKRRERPISELSLQPKTAERRRYISQKYLSV